MFEKLTIELHAERLLGSADVTIWAEDGKLHYSKELFDPDGMIKVYDPEDPKAMDDHAENVVSEFPLEDFNKKMELLHIEGWEKYYEPVDYMVLDGESWSLEYKTTEGAPIEISGSNAYPRQWKKLIRIIRSVVGKTGMLK